MCEKCPWADISLSFNHLVGAAEQRNGYGNAEYLGSLEVDDQLNLRGLLDGQIGSLLTFENAPGVDASLTERVC
jgi:hypothetical protein